jgi:hypothetical protein
VRARLRLGRGAGRGLAVAIRALRWTVRRLRPLAVLLLRGLALAERGLRRAAALLRRAVKRGAAELSVERAACALVLASAAGLAISQLLDYRAVEIGQPGYAGLPAASPPRTGVQTAGQTHAYLLIGPALLAAALAPIALRKGRPKLGLPVFALGLASLLVVLLVDRPAGLDASAQASRFAGARAVLLGGFYLELAAAAGLMLGGLLLAYKPMRPKINLHRHRYRPRKPSLARTQGDRRRARTVGCASKAAD